MVKNETSSDNDPPISPFAYIAMVFVGITMGCVVGLCLWMTFSRRFEGRMRGQMPFADDRLINGNRQREEHGTELRRLD